MKKCFACARGACRCRFSQRRSYRDTMYYIQSWEAQKPLNTEVRTCTTASSNKTYRDKIKLFRREHFQNVPWKGMLTRPFQYFSLPIVVFCGFMYGSHLLLRCPERHSIHRPFRSPIQLLSANGRPLLYILRYWCLYCVSIWSREKDFRLIVIVLTTLVHLVISLCYTGLAATVTSESQSIAFGYTSPWLWSYQMLWFSGVLAPPMLFTGQALR